MGNIKQIQELILRRIEIERSIQDINGFAERIGFSWVTMLHIAIRGDIIMGVSVNMGVPEGEKYVEQHIIFNCLSQIEQCRNDRLRLIDHELERLMEPTNPGNTTAP